MKERLLRRSKIRMKRVGSKPTTNTHVNVSLESHEMQKYVDTINFGRRIKGDSISLLEMNCYKKNRKEQTNKSPTFVLCKKFIRQ